MLNYLHKHTARFFIFSIIFAASFSSRLEAQNSNDITIEDFENKSYKYGVRAASNGFGFYYRNTKPFKAKWSKALDIDLSSLRHPKEVKVLNSNLGNASPYVYNKVNRVYNLRILGGLHYSFAERHSKNSVGIGAFAVIGPTISIVKPTYVDIQTIDPSSPSVYIIVSKRYEPEKLDNSKIEGFSSYFTGIENTKLRLGMSLKTGLEFNWGNYSSEFKSIEAGFVLDYLGSNTMILYIDENKNFYSGFYISFAFGKNK